MSVPSPGIVTSDMPKNYVPTESFTVSLPVQPPTGGFSYAVEDGLPSGWSAINISDGGEFDSVEMKVRWFFLDDISRTLSYTAVPETNATGLAVFAGAVSFDGLEQTIEGERKLAGASRLSLPVKTTGGGVALSVRGEIGAHYVIEGSTDLIAWNVLQTAINVTGILQLAEPAVGPSGYRFYRARKLP